LDDNTDLVVRSETLPIPIKRDGTMTIALETVYASVGQDHELVGRTYMRVREVGTFTSDTPYPVIRDLINVTLKEEQLRDQKMLEVIESSVEHRRKINI
jgi:hypothetical protein